jgi:hypothetical protein
MKYANILEEEIKNKVTRDYFQKFDCTKILGKIDFAVKVKRSANAIDFTDEYLLWAEAKQKTADIPVMLAQLVLTIGKARTFDELMPPRFIGCFDGEKIAFVPYSDIQDIFYQNDFNWKVAPSDRETREFKQVYAQIEKIINSDVSGQTYIFYFEKDDSELKQFIGENFIIGKTETSKIRIDKNNFTHYYNKWLETVKPTIQVDWGIAKRNNIIDGDFYLADLISDKNKTLREKLFVLLKTDHYELDRTLDDSGFKIFKTTAFSDNQKAHAQFWTKYERPPLKEYWDYIVDHRHLLVPQDVRERKGSFYTPRIWVELSQKYLADVFGKDWQDEYYVWDCAAGTGNLLVGLTNKYNIWASTLDKADVDVMKDRIQNGANLLESHVFQFDFLNDDFSKLPKDLQDIINNEKQRRKLIIYINPPYAEVSSIKGGKKGVNQSKIRDKYSSALGTAGRELFTQFFIRISKEIPYAKLASFSKLKYISGSAFESFRNNFFAEYKNGFVCLSTTFDNVSGQFPIGFLVWNLEKRNKIKTIECDVFDNSGNKTGTKRFYAYTNSNYINEWISSYNKRPKDTYLGFLAGTNGNGFQHNNIVYILNKREQMENPRGTFITIDNLIESCIYHAVRHCIKSTWLNDRDQFLYPNDGWKTDEEFQNDCLAYTLFNNNIRSKYGVNHWIPFSEQEVNARDKFDSHFMLSFIGGRIIQNGYSNLFEHEEDKWCIKREFSPEAAKVFDAGRELWKYYHAQPQCNVNASLYDIREYFQGRSDNGNMNSKSDDETYNKLIDGLRSELKTLAEKIEPKVYEYGFLKR